ncbi:MAG: ATP-binding protein [Rhizomicrobium sp.]
MANKYSMRISRLTVDKLGVKLYDRASAVISELISNSYDADATLVTIEAPMGQFLATQAGGKITDKGFAISVIDNGIGMTPAELQDFYLIIGKERRNDPKQGSLSRIFKRHVTGRKGVGKLAPFGICRTIEVISAGGELVDGKDASGKRAKGYLTSHVILDYEKIAVDDGDKNYEPTVGKLDGTVSKASGTTTRLSGFAHRRVPDMDDLSRQIAQRFGLPSKNWSIVLQDNTKTKGSAGYETKVGDFKVETMPNTKIVFHGPETTFLNGAASSKYYVTGPDGETIDDLAAGFFHDGQFYPVRGWVAYSKVPYKDDLMAGVRIYCRGKIAAQTSVFGRKAGFTGEHNVRSYLVGQIDADWLDEKEDLIQTDRRDLLWSDEVASAFEQWGQKIVARIGTLARDPLRKSAIEKFFEVGNVEKRITQEFPGAEQKEIRDSAVEVARTLGRAISPGDLDDEDVVKDFVDLTLLLAPHITLDEMLRAAADEPANLLGAISSILRTARLAELASFGRIAEDRIRVIEKLEQLKDDDDTNEDEFQKLIEDAPWLINPQWAPVSANASFNTLRREFEKFYKKNIGKEIYLGEFSSGKKRPDFVLSSQDTYLQVIEIKKPGHKIANAEMDRIITYDEQFDQFLSDPKHEEFKQMVPNYKITLVADGHSLTGAQKKSYESMIKEGRLEHITWRSFLARTRKMHRAFLDEAERQKKIAREMGKTS